ncbi:hypothetical protein N7509_011800 [Penicillium cosmopolitanum]|uniref:Uncharacterized protein n=1 Tax=Penicillium cosmopolitanum TaxID=1131564 RepID=A0A9W9SHI4_9EURO|nr:uncharacterized protein N7509_011800 [Penicillium cosmopolitanum]KAJ5378681.1 hypothetical protein N7509_011800 [Penicillium cosmopolitanum]
MDADSLPDFQLLPYSSQDPDSNGGESESLSPTSDNSITLNASSSWTYCGPLLTLEENSLPSSFHTWARATVNGSLLTPLFSFLAYVHEFLAANNLAHYWLTVRATQGSTEFDIPRWHTDDLFFSPLAKTKPQPKPKSSSISRKLKFTTRNYHTPPPQEQTQTHRRNNTQHATTPDYDALNPFIHPQPFQTQTQPQPKNAQIITPNSNPPDWKLCTTLLGPGTIFINEKRNLARSIQRTTKTAVQNENPGHICLSIRCVGCASAADAVRTRLATDLKSHQTVQSQQGECVFFRVGEEEGAVHSEPRSHGDRVFVNVVPGDERDLRCLMAKWGMEFPRAWCVGLPLQIEGEEVYRNVCEV